MTIPRKKHTTPRGPTYEEGGRFTSALRMPVFENVRTLALGIIKILNGTFFHLVLKKLRVWLGPKMRVRPDRKRTFPIVSNFLSKSHRIPKPKKLEPRKQSMAPIILESDSILLRDLFSNTTSRARIVVWSFVVEQRECRSQTLWRSIGRPRAPCPPLLHMLNLE
jgi:hypothetical protein